MKILLITSNATIEKLFVLSAEKKGDEVDIGLPDNLPEGEYDAVFLDKDQYTEELFKNLKNVYGNAKFVLIVSKNDEKILGFDEYLTKPFLPTDLMELLEKLPMISSDEDYKTSENFSDEEMEDLKDLDLEDDFGSVGELKDLEDELDFDLEDMDEENVSDENVEPLDEHTYTEDNNSKEPAFDDELFDELESEKDLKELAQTEGLDEEDFEISEEELESEAPDDDIEESFEIDENELVYDEKTEPEIAGSDIESLHEEKDLPENDEMTESLEEETVEDISEDVDKLGREELEDYNIENILEKEDVLENEEHDEFVNLDENELARVLGEELENEEQEKEREELDVENEKHIEEINIDDKIPEIKQTRELEELVNEKPIEEKTLGSILNINWEELKKAKAKVTITIDFGD
ncbi:hypothetical protein [Nautilia sp.]